MTFCTDKAFLYDTVQPMKATLCQWDNCFESFLNDYNCFQHVKKVHTPNMSNRCFWDKCEYQSPKRHNNLNHVKKHFKLVQGCCLICRKTFKWKFDLTKHVKHFHHEEDVLNQSLNIEGIPLISTVRKSSAVKIESTSIAFLLN